MNEGNIGIAIVTMQYSVIVKGMEKRLSDQGYRVVTIENDYAMVREYPEGMDLFILYIADNIMDDVPKLKELTLMVKVINEIPRKVIVMGEKSSHDELLSQIPAIGRYVWVDKPVDNDKLNEVIKSTLASNDDPGRKKRILIVDDDPSYAKMVREWIKDVYRVDIVTAGMQAISFLFKVKEDEPVDLILLDYEMPVVDGPQVLQMLRQEPATENIPVIFLTGVGSKEAVSRVMELKPDGYILKSTTRGDLLGYLDKKLRK